MPSTGPVKSIINCYQLIVSYINPVYTASLSRNAQLSQLDLVFLLICQTESVKQIQNKITIGVCKFVTSTQENTLFSRKIYTAGTNSTRQLIETVATNLNTGLDVLVYLRNPIDVSSRHVKLHCLLLCCVQSERG